MALKERITDEESANGQTLILMVLGAGRGPLVRASLKAAELSHRKIKVYAVEKNPNAGKYTFYFPINMIYFKLKIKKTLSWKSTTNFSLSL